MTRKDWFECIKSHRLGILIPLNANTKQPVVKEWSKLSFDNPYTGPFPDGCNFGNVVAQDIIVIDIDLKPSNFPDQPLLEAARAWIMTRPEFQDTLAIQTPSGGLHFYFRCREIPAGIKGKIKVAALLAYPDIKCVDVPLHVVVPPSVIDDKKYTVICEAAPRKISNLIELPLIWPDMADTEINNDPAGFKLQQVHRAMYRQIGVSKRVGGIDEGERNNMLFRIACQYGKRGVPLIEALADFNDWFLPRFANNATMSSTEIERTFDSGYKRALTEDVAQQDKEPKEVQVDRYMKGLGWQFRYNLIPNEKQFKRPGGQLWERMNDFIESEIAMEATKELRVGNLKESIKVHIESNMSVNQYNAVDEWINGVKPERSDALNRFLDCLDTDVDKDLLYWTFRYWLLNAIYTMKGELIENGKANPLCLVFAGSQGIGKTSLAKRLCPRELQKDYYLLGYTQHRDQDSLAARYCFINLDDIDNMAYSESKNLKSVITQHEVKWRSAYGRHEMSRPAVANFLATTNKIDVLTDDTGNRRYFPIEVFHVNWAPIDANIMDEVWKNALMDYYENKHDEIRGEVEKLKVLRDEHVEKFEKVVEASEIFSNYFDSTPDSNNSTMVEIQVTQSQIMSVFQHYYKHMDKQIFSSYKVSSAFRVMQVGVGPRTKKSRYRVIYVDKTRDDSLITDLLRYDEFNRFGGPVPTPGESSISDSFGSTEEIENEFN